MRNFREAKGWNKGILIPWVNEYHSQPGDVFSQAGVPYPGASNGRIVIDDTCSNGFDYISRQLKQFNNPGYFYHLFRI